MSIEAESSAKSVTGVLEENTNSVANGSIETGAQASDLPLSPRVSTIDTDEASVTKKEQTNFQQEASQDYRDYSAPGLDSLHWAGVKKRGDFDQRSVASSMNAERDDQSIYEQPGVGAVEETEEQLNENVAEEVAYPTNLTAPEREEEEEHVDKHKTGNEQQQQQEEEEEEELEEEQKSHGKATSPSVQGRAIAHKASSSLAPSTTDADVSSVLPPSEDNDLLEELILENSEGRVEGSKESYGKHGSFVNPSDAGDMEGFKSEGETAGETAGEVAGMEVSTSPRTLGLPPSPVSRTSTDYEPLPESSLAVKPKVYTSPAPFKRNTELQKPEGDGSDMAEVELSPGKDGGLPEGQEPEQEPEQGPEQGGRELLENQQTIKPLEATTAVGSPESETQKVASNKDTNGLGAEVEDVDLENTTHLQPATQSPKQEESKLAPVMVDLGPQWENMFKGLLYVDGMDALGRPVVVLNADAVPPRMKSSALVYVKAHLEPLVSSGEYVIVFTARKAKLPSFWIMGAYQSLPRPYRKNVQYVVLVRPTGFLKAILAFMRPFVSRKAGRKIKTVDRLEEIGEVTGGEVTMHHLGKRFLDDDAMAAATMAAADRM